MAGNQDVRTRNRRIRVALTLFGLLLVVLVPVAPANAATSIKLSRSVVIGGESISITGSTGVKKARKVVLQRLVGKKWVNVTPSRTTAKGAFRFLYKPPTKAGTKTSVRVLAPKVRISGKTYKQLSTPGRTVATVAQSAAINAPSFVAQNSSFTVTGRFSPARTGRDVVLQQRTSGAAWKNLGTPRFQSSAGAVSFPVKLSGQGALEFRVVALAEGGAPAIGSVAVSVTVLPPAPQGLTATPGNGKVDLTWNAISGTGVSYRVFRRENPSAITPWTEVAGSPTTGTSLSVSGLTNGTTYYFTVTSVVAGEGSAFAPQVSAKPVEPADTQAPPVPTGVTGVPGNASAQVSWSAVSAPDLAGYRVFRAPAPDGQWTQLTTTPVVGTTFNATELQNGQDYYFAVRSVDTSGNLSALSAPSAKVTPAPAADVTPPGPPAGVSATAGIGSAQVSWTPNAVVAPDLAGYRVFQSQNQNGPWTTQVAGSPTTKDATALTVNGLTAGTTYYFAVSSVDTSGNASAPVVSTAVTPTAPPAGWSSVSTGLQHSCAVGTDQTVWCWGYNGDGQLGSGANVTSPTPAKVGAAADWTSVSAGDDSTCGVRSNGTLWCWGSNKYGQLGNATNSGTVFANPTPVQVAGTTWSSVSVGSRFACATRTDSTLWCWGYSADGQTGRVLPNGSDPLGAYPEPFQVTGTTWSSVSAGLDHACALTSAGQVSCWGGNISGQLGKAANALANAPAAIAGSSWTAVSAGRYHTCALQGANAFCWGSNEYGELGRAANADPNPATNVAAGTGWTSISAGGDHTCGTKSDGVYCFGRNLSGQLGKTANANANPTASKVTSSGATWTSVESGAVSTCARTTASKVFCWGSNADGQLGSGAAVGATPVPTPVEVVASVG